MMTSPFHNNYAAAWRGAVVLIIMFFAAHIATAAADDNPAVSTAGLPVVTLSINGGEVQIEVAADDKSRQKGLSEREDDLPPDTGMLLVAQNVHKLCLWMKNVYFNLDAAFINDEGEVVSKASMLAHTLDIHCPPVPVRYALEVPEGWLEKYNVQMGDIVTGLEAVADAAE